MLESSQEIKAQKLAAARKKLKEYKQQVASADNTNATPSESHGQGSSTPTASVSSNLSERSDSETKLNGHVANLLEPATSQCEKTAENMSPATAATTSATSDETSVSDPPHPTSVASYFAPSHTLNNSFPPRLQEPIDNVSQLIHYQSQQQHQQQTESLQTIQVLINEKAQLMSELNKYRTMCREKDYELEELRTRFGSTNQRLEELNRQFVVQQQNAEQLRNTNAELQHKLAQANANIEDQSAHLDELKGLLDMMQKRGTEMEMQFKEKSNELEMTQLRIRQLSDEGNIEKDNRVEILTQAQFVHEQQIRDLQAMVQQLTQDKDQASIQYQSYSQHLNAEVAKLTEKNAELTDECHKLRERERQLVEHVGGLEKEIQKNISRQRDERTLEIPQNATHLEEELQRLKEKLGDFDMERHEFQLKIKSQEDCLENLKGEIGQKEIELESLRQQLESVTLEQPNKMKLLATMESDKVAASRALTQNVELKKQLDELEMRFVQLTNDKAELINKLDAEQHSNREMRVNYHAMEERVHEIDERFKYKDDEMIRLSHENMELTHKIKILQQRLEGRGHHNDNSHKKSVGEKDSDHCHEHGHNHEHDHIHDDHDSDTTNHGEASDHHDHDHDHGNDHSESELCKEVFEDNFEHPPTDHTTSCAHVSYESEHDHERSASEESTSGRDHNRSRSSQLPNDEALFRLQQRFMKLISQMADLSEEKQRLEHLVLQLQSETETIGEYIALYQQQRRILKQREYEKAAQMQLLQNEREQLHEKINILNNLVSSLGHELPQNSRLKEHLRAALAESASNEPTAPPELGLNDGQGEPKQLQHVHQNQESQELLEERIINDKLNSSESQQILTKIQDIITEMKENTTKDVAAVTQLHTADHLQCCSGKVEVV